MSGRGRGKRAASVSNGPGRPAKSANIQEEQEEESIMSIQAQQQQQQQQLQQQQLQQQQFTGSSPSLPDPSSNNGSGGLVDILSQLNPNRRQDMLGLVAKLKSRQINVQVFLENSKGILGERLYAQLARGMMVKPSPSNTTSTSTSSNVGQRAASLQPGMAAQIVQQQQQQRVQSTMQSMPQIFGMPAQISVPAAYPIQAMSASNLPSVAFSQQPVKPITVLNTSTTTSIPTEVDVTKMDSASLQDVIQYSGVDLKAEAEMIFREHDNFLHQHPNIHQQGLAGVMQPTFDPRLRFDYFFNAAKFKAIVQAVLLKKTSQLREQQKNSNGTLMITDEAVNLLGIALQKRMISVISRLSEISKHRIDIGRSRFKIKIENDPKKQIWLLERLFVDGLAESSGSSSTTTSSMTKQPVANPTPSSIGGLAKSTSGTIGGVAPNPSSGDKGRAGDDATVKTKLANVTAMAALGLRQKSWMSSAAIGTSTTSKQGTSTTSSQSQSTDSSSSPTIQGGSSDNDGPAPPANPLSQFYSLQSSTPLTDSELAHSHANRTITVSDLINFMEDEPKLRASKLLAVLYDTIPSE